MKKLTFGEVLEDGGGRDEYFRVEDVETLCRPIISALRDPYDSLPPDTRAELAKQLAMGIGDGCQHCGHPVQITTPTGPCAKCGRPWD